MERKDELEARVREAPLSERLDECRKRIGKMCSEGRPPRMCIPVQWDDDDFYISTTLADAQRALDVAMADNRSYINERHENMKTIEALQAQLADKAAVEIGLRHANDDLHVMLGRAEAQLRQVDGENELLKSGQRYMALEKERDTLQQLVEALPVLDMRFDSVAVGPLGWTVGGVTFGKVTEANAYSALLQYRATLAAKDAPRPTEEQS